MPRYILFIAALVALSILIVLAFPKERNAKAPQITLGYAGEVQKSTPIFSLDYYRKFLEELKKPRYLVLNVKQFVLLSKSGWRAPSDRVTVILRHDCDNDIDIAFKMAEMEHEMGINASYYVRVRDEKYNVLSESVTRKIRQMYEWGFDVGLHYEDLYASEYSTSRYNISRALSLFELDLQVLRSIIPVDTACAHGNKANMTYRNFDMFSMANKSIEDFGLVSECYLSVLPYLRTYQHYWRTDNMGRPNDWIKIVENAKPGQVVYLLIHPCYYGAGGESYDYQP
ncbi:MAG: hypothetical protein ACP5JF_05090 [Candidatus Methanodesulfokora sp.]|jgi:hypothetical protein